MFCPYQHSISLVQSGIYFTHRVQLVKWCLVILKDFSWSNVNVISDHAKIFFYGKTYFLLVLSYSLKVKHFYMSFPRDFLNESNIVKKWPLRWSPLKQRFLSLNQVKVITKLSKNLCLRHKCSLCCSITLHLQSLLCQMVCNTIE